MATGLGWTTGRDAVAGQQQQDVRNFGDLRWRSDMWQGLLLGESLATVWLRVEKVKGTAGTQGWLKSFEFTSFGGQKVV